MWKYQSGELVVNFGWNGIWKFQVLTFREFVDGQFDDERVESTRDCGRSECSSHLSACMHSLVLRLLWVVDSLTAYSGNGQNLCSLRHYDFRYPPSHA